MDIDLGQLEILRRLGIALATGLLIGLERGWSDREEEEGQRIAGLRTFGLIALLGALWAFIYITTGSSTLVLAFLGLAGLIIVAQWMRSLTQGGFGITTPVAAMIAFVLGAIAGLGHVSVAAATAVVVALLLGLKTRLHSTLRRLDEKELFATFKLLLISVVLLPILPNEGYGPWQALNPYAIWWMVVLVAAISYCGYFAIRIAGPQRGILLTALSGGLVSSTAVTLTLARMQKQARQFDPIYSTAIILASFTMFPRMLIWVAVFQPGLLQGLAWPLGFMILSSGVIGLLCWRDVRNARFGGSTELSLHNPFELKIALQMGAILAAVMLLAKALSAWFGDAGVYVLAVVSGIGDVDAITLTLSRMSGDEIQALTAVTGITLAGIMNTLTKVGLAWGVGGMQLGRYVALRFAIILFTGLLGLFVINHYSLFG